jgi:hypothetical protein
MALIDKLTKGGSVYSEFDGATPKASINDLKTSKTHFEYSINGNPNLPGKPAPSLFDLDGKTPSKYLDNLPG